jgi:hypothetical protein
MVARTGFPQNMGDVIPVNRMGGLAFADCVEQRTIPDRNRPITSALQFLVIKPITLPEVLGALMNRRK